jgi:hypothetical protein
LRKARKRLFHSLNQIQASDAAQQLSWWGMFRRQPAFSNISPARLCSELIEVTPLLGKNYIMELLKLQGIDLLNKNFYRKLIHDKFPELRKIIYSQTGAPISGEYNYSTTRLGLKAVIYTLLPFPFLFDYYSKIRQKLRPQNNDSTGPSLEALIWCEQLSADFLGTRSKQDLMKIEREINNPDNMAHYFGVMAAIEWTRSYLDEFNQIG